MTRAPSLLPMPSLLNPLLRALKSKDDKAKDAACSALETLTCLPLDVWKSLLPSCHPMKDGELDQSPSGKALVQTVLDLGEAMAMALQTGQQHNADRLAQTLLAMAAHVEPV